MIYANAFGMRGKEYCTFRASEYEMTVDADIVEWESSTSAMS